MKRREDYKIRYFLTIGINTPHLSTIIGKNFVYYITGCVDDSHARREPLTVQCNIPKNIIEDLQNNYLLNCWQFDVDGFNEDGYTFYNIYWATASENNTYIVIDFIKEPKDEIENIILEKIKHYFSHINTELKNIELKLYKVDGIYYEVIKDYLEP